MFHFTQRAQNIYAGSSRRTSRNVQRSSSTPVTFNEEELARELQAKQKLLKQFTSSLERKIKSDKEGLEVFHRSQNRLKEQLENMLTLSRQFPNAELQQVIAEIKTTMQENEQHIQSILDDIQQKEEELTCAIREGRMCRVAGRGASRDVSRVGVVHPLSDMAREYNREREMNALTTERSRLLQKAKQYRKIGRTFELKHQQLIKSPNPNRKVLIAIIDNINRNEDLLRKIMAEAKRVQRKMAELMVASGTAGGGGGGGGGGGPVVDNSSTGGRDR